MSILIWFTVVVSAMLAGSATKGSLGVFFSVVLGLQAIELMIELAKKDIIEKINKE